MPMISRPIPTRCARCSSPSARVMPRRSPASRASVIGCARSSTNCSAIASAGARSGSIPTSWRWRLRRSSRPSPQSKPRRNAQRRRDGPARDARPTAGPCRPTCRGSRRWSTSPTRPVRAAPARCTRSARMSPSGWMWCRPSSGSWWFAGPSTPAGPAWGGWCRRQPRPG